MIYNGKFYFSLALINSETESEQQGKPKGLGEAAQEYTANPAQELGIERNPGQKIIRPPNEKAHQIIFRKTHPMKIIILIAIQILSYVPQESIYILIPY